MFSRPYLVFQLSCLSHFQYNFSQEMQFLYFVFIACVAASDSRKRSSSAVSDPVDARSARSRTITEELSYTLTENEKRMFYDWAIESMVEEVRTVVIRAASTIEPPYAIPYHLERALFLAELLLNSNNEPENVLISIKNILPRGTLTLAATKNFAGYFQRLAGMPAWAVHFLKLFGTNFDENDRLRLAAGIRGGMRMDPAMRATHGNILDRWIRIWGIYCIIPSRILAESDPRPCEIAPQIPGSSVPGRWRLTDYMFRRMIADEMTYAKNFVSQKYLSR